MDATTDKERKVKIIPPAPDQRVDCSWYEFHAGWQRDSRGNRFGRHTKPIMPSDRT